MDNHFYKINKVGDVSDTLAKLVQSRLADSKVLLLLSGGSAIDVALASQSKLEGSDLSGLTVSLADERFGPIGHPDSNWQQLADRGFRMPGATLHPFLSGKAIEQTLNDLNGFFLSQFHKSVYKVALLGMGTDGHTAGVLPGSPATNSADIVVSYQAADFHRLTLGFSGLAKLDEAILYAVGKDKAAQLEKLQADRAPTEQPAQIIKRMPRWTVYNDRIGEEI